MATYFMDFQNNTDRVWTMAMYQTLPNSAGLDSVSWLQASAPKGGNTGVQFDVTYNVVLGNFASDGGRGVYKSSQTLPADLGTAWNIIFDDGVQQLEPAGAAPLPQQILITNRSGKIGNPGIGMSGQGSVYKKDVNDDAAAQFQVTPTYWIGLFNDVVKGEVISSNVLVGPKKVVYPSGETSATLTADLDGASIKMILTFGDSPSVTLAEIDTRQNFLAFSRKSLAKAR